MTPDDFKQKCDEIHRIVCYLDDNDKVPPIRVMNSIWLGHIEMPKELFQDGTEIGLAVMFLCARNELKHSYPDAFLENNWTLK